MKGIRLLTRALASLEKTQALLDRAAKEIEGHKAQNDKTLAVEHGHVHRWLAVAEDAYRRSVAYANAHRDRATAAHRTMDAMLTTHQQRANRVRDRFKELLA